MTSDIVALVRHQPDVRTVIEGMIAFGEPLDIREAEGGVSHVYDSEDHLLFSIEVPVFVQVAGEVERLLGPEVGGQVQYPVWWVDIRASATLGATRLARRFADDMVHWQGGAIWPMDQPVGGQL